MPKLFFFLFIFSLNELYAQQKINYLKYPDGTETYHLITKIDTLAIVNYPNGKRESMCKLKNGLMQGTYSRWHENGNKMWVKEMNNGLVNGKSMFYNNKAELIAELIYKNGALKDTIFLKPEVHIIIGKINYSSIVYGGAQNADGSSNVSENSGPFINYSMYAVLLDSIKKPAFICSYKSDMQGDFMISVPSGNIGLYPAATKIDSLKPPYDRIPENRSMSGNDTWDVNLPITITKSEIIKTVNLMHTSVGYAP
jgi:hypothetical protein